MSGSTGSVVNGGDGNEGIVGSNNADTIDGGNGNDTIGGFAGNDSILGGQGDDRIDGGDDADIALGGLGNDLIQGGNGDDHLSGENGADTLTGAAGADTMLGGTENDSLLGGIGNDSLLGGDGADTMGYLTASSAVTVDLVTGRAIGADGNDTLSGIENVQGGGFADSILGDNSANILAGGDGADTILGGAGDDSVLGGNSSDRITGGAGSDTIDFGGGSSDRVLYNHEGGEAISATITNNGSSSGLNRSSVATATQGTDSIIGFEILIGSNLNDRITVNSAATAVENLFLFGGGGYDTIIDNYRQNGVFADYNSTNSALTAGISVDLIGGSATDGLGGVDSLVGITAINATSFADTLLGSASNDRFRGWEGNDSVDGRGGTGDMMDYSQNASNQAVSVNLASQRANDGMGFTDTLISIEQVRGGAGNDTIFGDDQNNTFRGNAGNDLLDGGVGSADAVEYSFAGVGVSVNLSAGRASDGTGGTDTLANIEQVWGSAYADTLIGGSGNDVLIGGTGSDSIDAGAGTFDVVRYNVSGGEAILADIGIVGPHRGGYNTATISTATQGTDTVINFEYLNGSANNDSFNITNAATYYAYLAIFANTGNDTLISSAALDGPHSNIFAAYDAYSAANSDVGFTRGVSVDLHIGNDTLGRPFGSATDYAGTDSLIGMRGIIGTALNDTIYGTAFDDRFRPDAGNDIMNGRDGFDMADYSSNSSGQAVSISLDSGRANDGRGGIDTLIGIENIRGGGGNDTLLGSFVSEAFRGGAGNDSIFGGLGSDRIEYFDSSATSGVSVNLIAGTASDGRGGTDSFSSIENVYGGELNDYLVGVGQSSSTSRLRGDAGNDTLVGEEFSYIIADYGSQTSGLLVNLASGSVNDGLGGVDVLINIRGAQMFGNFADTLLGTSSSDWFAPGAGNDSVDGGSGMDILAYGGNPSMGVSVNLAGGVASDGDGGIDVFSSIEMVVTSYSNDTVIGDGGANVISLGAGADYSDGASGRDIISYALGFSDGAIAYTYNEVGNALPFSGVTIDLSAGRATDYSGAVDTLVGFEDADGSTMHDSILGSSADNEFDGLGGNDTIDGGAGNDTIWSDEGDDRFLGGAGNDLYLMAFATGSVTISDISGNDTVSLSGAMGIEVLVSDLSTASGIDAFNLAGGGNTLHLNTGAVRALSETDVLWVYGSGDDNLIFDDPSAWTRGATSGDFVTFTTSLGGNATVIASQSLVPSLTGGPTFGDDALDGTSGMDAIDLLAGNDTYLGLGGDDSILGNDGADSILGGDGADIIVGGSGVDTLDGGGGNDTLSGSAGPNRLLGGIGSDFYHVISTLDSIIENLSAGTDTIMTSVDLTLPTNVEMLMIAPEVTGITVTGGAGGDTLIGNGLSNTYNGGAGDDVILVGNNLTLADLYALFAT